MFYAFVDCLSAILSFTNKYTLKKFTNYFDLMKHLNNFENEKKAALSKYSKSQWWKWTTEFKMATQLISFTIFNGLTFSIALNYTKIKRNARSTPRSKKSFESIDKRKRTMTMSGTKRAIHTLDRRTKEKMVQTQVKIKWNVRFDH